MQICTWYHSPGLWQLHMYLHMYDINANIMYLKSILHWFITFVSNQIDMSVPYFLKLLAITSLLQLMLTQGRAESPMYEPPIFCRGNRKSDWGCRASDCNRCPKGQKCIFNAKYGRKTCKNRNSFDKEKVNIKSIIMVTIFRAIGTGGVRGARAPPVFFWEKVPKSTLNLPSLHSS